jgi:hypothetical protein
MTNTADLNGKTIAVNGLRDLTQYEVQPSSTRTAATSTASS